MQEAVPVGKGAMAALLGADLDKAQELAKAAADGQVCEAANDNAPGQVVISGAKEAIERAVALAPKFGARRAVLLPVSAPFHCALMKPAADVMRRALQSVEIKTPAVPLVANVLASPISDPEAIRARLVEQVTGMVRWRETMLFLKTNGASTVYEIGAGRVLTGIARRFDGVEARSVGTPDELEAAAAGAERLGKESYDVRPQEQRRAGHRGLRRDRRGDRQGAARTGRERRDFGHQQGEARALSPPSSAAACSCCLAISAIAPQWPNSARKRRRRSARSTSWSTMPALPTTICSCA